MLNFPYHFFLQVLKEDVLGPLKIFLLVENIFILKMAKQF